MTELAAIYSRVSTQEQATDDKTSLEQQERRCRAYCEAHDWEVAQVYCDAGVSGVAELADRPALVQLLADAADGQFTHLVFLKIDRLARKTKKLLDVSEKLDAYKVGLASVMESFDTSTSSGRLYFTMLGAIAEFERDGIIERTTEARRASQRDGKKYTASITPFGYKRRKGGKLRVDEEQAALVRRIFHMAAYEGLGLHQIANALNAEGVRLSEKTNSVFGVGITSVSKILHAERYVGRSTYAGQPATCPCIVSDEVFEAAQQALAQRKRTAPRNVKNTYLLRSKLTCGHCSATYLSETTRFGKQIYACRDRRVHGSAAGHSEVKWRWDAAVLEERVKDRIREFIADPDTAAKMIQTHVNELTALTKSVKDKMTPLKAKIDELTKSEERVIDAFSRGKIPERNMVKQCKTLRDEREAAEEQLAALQAASKAPDPKLVVNSLIEFWSGISANLANLKRVSEETGVEVAIKWNDWDEKGWAAAINHFVDEIVVQDDGSLMFKGAVAVQAPQPKSVLQNQRP